MLIISYDFFLMDDYNYDYMSRVLGREPFFVQFGTGKKKLLHMYLYV